MILARLTAWVRRIVREEIAAEDERRSHEFAAFCQDGQTASDRALTDALLRERPPEFPPLGRW
jgi:hypothetical protein